MPFKNKRCCYDAAQTESSALSVRFPVLSISSLTGHVFAVLQTWMCGWLDYGGQRKHAVLFFVCGRSRYAKAKFSQGYLSKRGAKGSKSVCSALCLLASEQHAHCLVLIFHYFLCCSVPLLGNLKKNKQTNKKHHIIVIHQWQIRVSCMWWGTSTQAAQFSWVWYGSAGKGKLVTGVHFHWEPHDYLVGRASSCPINSTQ